MKFFTLFAFLILLSFVAMQAQEVSKFNTSEYVAEIIKARKQKDTEISTDKHSLFDKEDSAHFKHLNYFKPNASFRIIADFKRFDQATRFLMKTTTDRLPEYSLYGVLNFKLDGKSCCLNVYQNIELVKKPGYEKHLFVPFNDETNGKKTYGGGRFLDISETGADTLVIDFNKAYNPYCAYSHKFSCPIPPEENNLKCKVNAGEKRWHK